MAGNIVSKVKALWRSKSHVAAFAAGAVVGAAVPTFFPKWGTKLVGWKDELLHGKKPDEGDYSTPPHD